MKKILAIISTSDRDEGLKLNSLYNTYLTLLKIDRFDLDKVQIKNDLKKCKEELEDFWIKITEKYAVPLYMDKRVVIDYEKSCICIIEE